MKQLAVIVLVLIIATAGIPVVVGTMTEARLTEQAGIVSENDFFAVTVRDYERGWLTSSAKLDVGLSELYQERITQILIQDRDEPVSVPAIEAMLGKTITLIVDLSHGPIMTDNGLHAGFASSVIRLDPETEGLDKLRLKLGVPYLFEIRTHTGFSSTSEFETDVPPMVFEDSSGTFSFSGFTAEGTYDFTDRHVTSNGRIDSIEVASELVTVAAENVTFTGDNRMISTYVWEGPLELVLERMTLVNATPSGPPYLEASNVGFIAHTSLNDAGDRLDMDLSYYVDSVTGDELTVTDAKFEVAMHNLDVAAVEAYNRIAQDLMFEPEGTALLMPALQETLYQLLAAEPGMDFGPLNFNWNGDAFEAVVRIRTDTEMLPPQVAFSLMDPSLWTRLFAVEAEMDVARTTAEWLAIEASKYQLRSGTEASGQELSSDELNAMAESQGPGMLLLLVAQGMIEVSEIGYRSQVAFEKGILDVNGREIPLGPQF